MSNLNCTSCRQPLEQARADLKLEQCYRCADQYTVRRKGAMTYSSQTTSEMEVLNIDQLANRRKYDPINRLW